MFRIVSFSGRPDACFAIDCISTRTTSIGYREENQLRQMASCMLRSRSRRDTYVIPTAQRSTNHTTNELVASSQRRTRRSITQTTDSVFCQSCKSHPEILSQLAYKAADLEFIAQIAWPTSVYGWESRRTNRDPQLVHCRTATA